MKPPALLILFDPDGNIVTKPFLEQEAAAKYILGLADPKQYMIVTYAPLHACSVSRLIHN
jgi:hypothetical protein